MLAFNFAGPSFAQSFDDDYLLVVPYKINPVSKPWSIRQEFRKCMYTSDECRAIVEAAGAYVGIPPGAIVETMKTADSIGLGVSMEHRGEEYWHEIIPPNGYHICRVRLDVTSAAPASGKYSPTFSISITPRRVNVYNFVHKLKVGQGRSWWDGQVTVVFKKGRPAPHSAFEAIAFGPGSECIFTYSRSPKVEYSCKGARGTNGGLPACNRGGWFRSKE